MKELLQYQETDLKIKKIESEIASSDARKNATEMQNRLKMLQEKLQNLEQQAFAVNERYRKSNNALLEAVKKVDALKAKSDKVKPSAADEFAEIINQMKGMLGSLDKEISSINKTAENISKDIESVMKNAKTAKSNLLFYKEQYDKLRASKDGELKSLKDELKKQESKVDSKLLAKYQSKAQGKTSKVVVPLENGRCGGCKMEVASSGLSKLEKEKMMECENCGRIIYLK